MELDVVVLAQAEPGERRRVLSVGEAKWGKVMGRTDLARLGRARDLLIERGFDTSQTILACYSGAGFESGLSEAQDRVLTVGIEDLYR
jgi:hypothetical protein